MKLDWALDGPIPWANPAVTGAGTVHVGGGEDAFLHSIEEGLNGPAANPFMLLGQQSIADPTRAPAGKHTAWAYTHGPQDKPWTEHIVERMEDQVERFAPGLQGPHPRPPRPAPGRPRGAQPEPHRRRRRRRLLPPRSGRVPPAAEAQPVQTPIDGLYIGSAATFPGGAVHGVPGDAAARAALK